MECSRTEEKVSLLNYFFKFNRVGGGLLMEDEQKKVSGAAALPKVGWKGMLALAFGILFFAGVFTTIQGAE